MLSKTELRQKSLKKRNAIPEALRKDLSEKAFDIFFREFSFPLESVISGYFPIYSEIDDLPILEAFSSRGYICSLPHVVQKNIPLTFRRWEKGAEMLKGEYGISEPVSKIEVEPDILIIPLLAFDKKRHRLGYGAGFYDRTLAQLKKQRDIQTIGLAYEEQLLEDIPVEESDIPLDFIVTDQKVYTCQE